MNVRADSGAIRRMLLAVDSTETLARRLFVQQARKDDHFAADACPPLLQKEAEGISCIQIKYLKVYDSATLEKERRLNANFAAAIDDRNEDRIRQLGRSDDHIANVPEHRAVRDPQLPLRRPPGPRLVNAFEFDVEFLQPTL